jgi:F-type H+/Na+-transporting ATPase subunit alpha
MTPPDERAITEEGGLDLSALLHDVREDFSTAIQKLEPELTPRETGYVKYVSKGIAFLSGLPEAEYGEQLRFPGGRRGMVFNLDPDEVHAVLLERADDLEAGDAVHRTGRVTSMPAGETMPGRVMDPAGRPLDGKGRVKTQKRLPIERPAPDIMDRAPVSVPLQTGIKAVDALVPVGRGQRELILGDRQTGKTAIAVDTIVNQRDYGVKCVYCAIGQRSAAIANVIADLRAHGAMDYTAVVATTGEDPAGLQFIAPYAATALAEYFMEAGEDVLIVYDDLTRHARAYREVSLLLRRPPGREAYPGDIFYIHSRLLERATHLNEDNGGGSLTALPVIETQAQNISAYIPTNLISITDGQIYLSPTLFQQGVMPPVDAGRSVSRVGGKAQLPAYRAVTADLKLAYSQFEELERFSRYGTRLEEEKRKTLDRGRRVREILKQRPFSPFAPGEQVAVLLAITEGLFDDVRLEDVRETGTHIRDEIRDAAPDLLKSIEAGEELKDDQREKLIAAVRKIIAATEENDADDSATRKAH